MNKLSSLEMKNWINSDNESNDLESLDLQDNILYMKNMNNTKNIKQTDDEWRKNAINDNTTYIDRILNEVMLEIIRENIISKRSEN